MFDLSRRLEQQQTAIGIDGVDAPTEDVAGESEVVLLRVVAEERETEAAFPLEGTVTRTGVAPHAAEHPHDVSLEVDLLQTAAIGKRNGGRGGRHRRQPQTECEDRDDAESTNGHGLLPPVQSRTRSRLLTISHNAAVVSSVFRMFTV